MPQNPALRLLLALVLFILAFGVFNTYAHYTVGFAASVALVGGGFLACLPKSWRS